MLQICQIFINIKLKEKRFWKCFHKTKNYFLKILFALSKVRSEHVPVSTTGIQCGESREDNTIDETSYARLNLRYCGWPDVGWVFHWAGRWWGSRVAQRHPSRGFPLSSHPRWRDHQLLSQTGILILYSRNITENFMFEEIFSMLIRPHPTHSIYDIPVPYKSCQHF